MWVGVTKSGAADAKTCYRNRALSVIQLRQITARKKSHQPRKERKIGLAARRRRGVAPCRDCFQVKNCLRNVPCECSGSKVHSLYYSMGAVERAYGLNIYATLCTQNLACGDSVDSAIVIGLVGAVRCYALHAASGYSTAKLRARANMPMSRL